MITLTPLEITLIALIWLITGLFIASKRNWYYKVSSTTDERIFNNVIAVLFAPINFIITLIKIYFINDWKE